MPEQDSDVLSLPGAGNFTGVPIGHAQAAHRFTTQYFGVRSCDTVPVNKTFYRMARLTCLVGFDKIADD